MRTLIVMLAAMFCFGLQAEAQRPERGKRLTPEEMAEQRTALMVQKYGLNQTQTDSLFALNMRQMEQTKDMRPERIPRDSLQAMDKDARKAYRKAMKEKEAGMRERMKKNAEEYEQALRQILTEEQFAKYQEDQKNRMERRERPRRGTPERRRPFSDDFEEEDF